MHIGILLLSRSVWPQGLQHAWPPCPLLSPGVWPSSCPLNSDAIQPSHPLSSPLLLPSVFPSIRVFSNELPLSIRWPKYWSFSFNISPSNEYSGFISFGIDWFDLLAVQGTLKSLLQHHDLKASIPWCIWRILNGMCLSVANIIHSIKCSKIIKNQKINIEKKEIL